MGNNDKRQEGIITNKWFLGKSEFKDIKKIRREVFIKEFLVDEKEEFDSFDRYAVHAVVYIDDIPSATGRIWHDGKKAMVGNIAVLKPFRGIGIGDLIIRVLLVKVLKSSNEVEICSPVYLNSFFSKFGFKAVGEKFNKSGISYIKMNLKREDFTLPSKCGCD